MSSDESSMSETYNDYDSGNESSSDSGSERDDNFDFDPFSERQIDLNIDKLLQQKSCPVVNQRDTFFNNPRFIVEEKRSPLTNFVDQLSFKRYNITDKDVPKAMELLEECRTKQIKSGMAERQLEHSGIMIDLDLLVAKEKSYLNKMIFQRMAAYIMQVLTQFLKFKYKSKEQIYMVFLRKPSLVYSSKAKAYKDGAHILLPGIQVTKSFKKYLYDFMQKDGGLKKILKDTKYKNLDDPKFIDPNAANVFVLMLGCVKEEVLDPYVMEVAYRITAYKEMPMIEEATDALRESTNLVHDLSLNWQYKMGVIKKRKFKVKDNIGGEIDAWNDRFKDQVLDEAELMETQSKLSTLCIQDPDVRYYKALLEIVDVDFTAQMEQKLD